MIFASGFGKMPGYFPDILHSHYGLVGLSLMGLDGTLKEMNVLLGLTTERVNAVTTIS